MHHAVRAESAAVRSTLTEEEVIGQVGISCAIWEHTVHRYATR